MKQVKRIISFILLLCMLASCFAFAATPNASIIGPAKNSVVSDDKLLVSVKVSNKKKVSVTVFEEQQFVGTKMDEEKKEEIPILKSIDVKDFTPEILEVLATEFEQKKALVIGEEEEKQELRSVAVAEPASYTATGEVGYFTKEIEELKPGLYRVQVEVLDKEDKVEETYNSFVALQEKIDETKTDETKKEETKTVPVETEKTSLVQFITKWIKALIK